MFWHFCLICGIQADPALNNHCSWVSARMPGIFPLCSTLVSLGGGFQLRRRVEVQCIGIAPSQRDDNDSRRRLWCNTWSVERTNDHTGLEWVDRCDERTDGRTGRRCTRARTRWRHLHSWRHLLYIIAINSAATQHRSPYT